MAVRNSGRATGRRDRVGSSRRRTRSGRRLAKDEDGAASRKSRRRRTKGLPDLLAILGRLSEALSVIVVAYRAIDERASDPEAAIVLAQGIAALNAVYNEIDIAEGQLYRAGLVRGRSS